MDDVDEITAGAKLASDRWSPMERAFWARALSCGEETWQNKRAKRDMYDGCRFVQQLDEVDVADSKLQSLS